MPARGYSSTAKKPSRKKQEARALQNLGRATGRPIRAPAPVRASPSERAGENAAHRRNDANLRRQVATQVREVKRGRGPKADTGDIRRGTRAPSAAESKRALRAELSLLAQPRRLTPSRERGALEEVLGAAGDAAHFLYPRGSGQAGSSKPRTAVIRAGIATPLQGTDLPVRVPVNVARAFAEAPSRTAKSTAKGLRDMLVGIPGGVIGAVTDPAGTAKQTGADYKRRYGPLLKGGGDREFIERVKKEGAAGEILDGTIVVSGPGGVAGRAASGMARKGALGKGAQRVVTEPRRAVRTSGGESRPQEIAPTLGRAAREKRRDEAAFRGQRRAAARADGRGRGAASKGPVRVEVRQALEAGDVVPSRRSGVRVSGGRVELSRVPSERKLDRAQRRAYATSKGRAVQALRREQRTEVGGAKRSLASLNRHEALAFKDALQLGATTPRAARTLIGRRLALIERERAKGDVDVLDTDEAPALRSLLAAPEAAFTQKLARVVQAERARGRRIAAGDPGVAETQATLRVTKPQAAALGIKRAGTPIRAAQTQARAATRTAKAARTRTGRGVEVRTRQAAREQGRAQTLAGQASRITAAQVGKLERAAEIHRRAAANHERRAQIAGTSDTRSAHTASAKAARNRADAATALLRSVEREAGTKPRRTLNRLERAQAALLEAERGRDAARNGVEEAKATQRDISARRRRGQELVDAEPVEAFVARTSAAADKAGAESPGYFPSRKREQVRHSSFAAGGTKAVQADKRYTGKLFREGREDASQTTYLQGVAQGIKRKHNWNLIADTFDAHTVPWGRDRTPGELEDELVRRGVDPDSVAFWNPRIYRAARSEWEKNDGRHDEGSAGEEPVAAGVSAAVRQASVDARGLATLPDAFRQTRGWSIVPKALHDEVNADTKPSGAFGRGLDVVKGKQARIMLGLSPAWLQFQIASNGLLTGLAGTGPLDMLKANLVWWRRLSDDEKAAIEPYVGVGPFADSYEQTRLGAASSAEIVNAYRAFKAHDFWHKPRKGGKSVRDANPLDVLFRIDNAQNNAFRRAVLYSQVKRDAYKRMGGRMRAIQRDQDGLARILTLGPEKAMAAVVRDLPALERHATHVNDFLGDYVTYTAKERRWLSRNVMFYGFLRFSLKFTFYTMPAKHPLLSSIVGQLGRMQTDEVRRLLGGDELPYALGRLYTVRDGKLKSIDVARGNPALNTLTSLRKLGSLVGLAPPMFAALADQVYSKSSFLGRPFRVHGETQGRKDDEYSLDDRVRIVVEQMLTLGAPYRAAKKATATGPEGEDSSLLLGRRPTTYKRPDIVAAIRRDEAARPKSEAVRLLQEFMPFIPRADNSLAIAKSIRERNALESGKPQGGGGGGDPAVLEAQRAVRDVQRAAGAADVREAQRALRDALR